MIEADPPSVAADLRRGKEVKNHSVGKGCDARLFDTLGYETCLPDMSALSNFVSLHPYFKVHRGRSDPGRSAWPGGGAGKVERASRAPQFGVVRDPVRCQKD